MEQLTDALQTAMQMEQEGRKTYLDASERVKDTVVAAILMALADDEAEHERMTERFYKAVQKHSDWPEPPQPTVGQEITPAIELVHQSVGKIKPDASFESVYENACELERKARDYYREQKAAADDRRLQEFFAFLVRVEQAHLDALQRVLYSTRRG